MERILIHYPNKKWFVLIFLTFLTAGILAFIAFYQMLTILIAIFFSLFLGLAMSGGLLILFVLDKQANRISKRITQTENELKAVSGIQHYTKLPLKLKDWAISAEFLERMVREIYFREPDLILELGSGTSTTIIASCLKDIGKGKVISFDHDEKYANITKRLLDIEGLNDYSEIILAPLKEYDLEGKKYMWYNFVPENYMNIPINMLIVDGPPSSVQKLSRYPAVPVLNSFLSDDSIIMLDDTNRPDEELILEMWKNNFNLYSEKIKARFSFDVLTYN